MLRTNGRRVLTLRELGQSFVNYLEDFFYTTQNKNILDWNISHIFTFLVLGLLAMWVYELLGKFFSSPAKGARVGRRILLYAALGLGAFIAVSAIVAGGA